MKAVMNSISKTDMPPVSLFDDDGFDYDTDGRATFIDEEGFEDGKIPEWNLIKAFDYVLEAARGKHCEIKGRISVSALDYLMDRLNMTKMQVLVIAILIDEGKPMSWGSFARWFGISRLSMMTYTDDVEALVNYRRWLINKGTRERGARFEGFALTYGVVTAIRHNEVFEPENISGLEEQDFVERLVNRICNAANDDDIKFADEEQFLMYFVGQNQQLPLCREVLQLDGDIHNKCLLLLIAADYARFAGQDNEGITIRNIGTFFPEEYRCNHMRRKLQDGTHELQQKGLVEFKCEDGMANRNCIVLSSKAKEELLGGYKPICPPEDVAEIRDRDLISYKDIKSKTLFYNNKEGLQVERLRNILSQEQMPMIQARLEEKGMRTGFAVLLSGHPGTGKTETVKQLARETGRDLLMIDISQIKGKFVGESEKNTKAIFERYKRMCKSNEVKPILFINECDAILGKRMENAELSVDKMQNTMQNILLQALEDLDGVIICTTNLAQSLDTAFERRFLMKIEFEKPDCEVRAKIWQAMIPALSDADAHILAENYDFSGGQCENVTRKATIEYILNGIEPNIKLLDSFCKEESLSNSNSVRPIAGFRI